jgi:hypothetical protein
MVTSTPLILNRYANNKKYFALELSFEVFTLLFYSKEDVRFECFPLDAILLNITMSECRRSVRLTFESDLMGYVIPEAGEIPVRNFHLSTRAMRIRGARRVRTQSKKAS